MRAIATVSLALFLAGCVTPSVHDHRSTSSPVDFSRYKSITYTVVETPETEYGSNDEGYGEETVDLFRTLLGQQLERMNYEVVSSGADLNLEIVVTAVKPGSGAARFWIGFGAGRAVLLYTATFKDDEKKIAGFDGGESYTGMEPGKAFSSKDEIKTFAALAGVEQVKVFMQNGGQFPEKKTGPKRSRTHLTL